VVGEEPADFQQRDQRPRVPIQTQYARHPTYLLGRVEKSFWYYFPVALTIKLSIPIFMIALTLLLLRAQALRNFAKAGAGALLAFSVLMRLQNGIRLVLPLVAFIIVGIAAAAATARRELGPGWKSQLLTCT
jgi:ABC-type dipeptide/oligopeptide/nickel transport system permease component